MLIRALSFLELVIMAWILQGASLSLSQRISNSKLLFQGSFPHKYLNLLRLTLCEAIKTKVLSKLRLMIKKKSKKKKKMIKFLYSSYSMLKKTQICKAKQLLKSSMKKPRHSKQS